ncbi:MAG: hypothetical protein FWF44_04220, partial [Defluviitaleaceae bacterium]|nr:hypothetical protein [Defluviitaleaceae bacterium]
MYPFSIGVLLDSFRTGAADALGKAEKLGVSGIQVYSTYGEMAPENLDAQKRKDFLKLVKSHGL